VFAKKDSANISNEQLEELGLLGKTLLSMKEAEIESALKSGALQGVMEDEND
jgi:hypothetical protein